MKYTTENLFSMAWEICFFDHKSERHGPWNEGFMVSLRLDKQTLPQFELYPYTQCNERPSVIPMNEAERKIFAERIDKLNQIISNEDQLNTTFETWAQKQVAIFWFHSSPIAPAQPNDFSYTAYCRRSLPEKEISNTQLSQLRSPSR